MKDAREVLSEFVAKAATQADLKSMRDAMLDQFGGVVGLAKECKLEYDRCTEGSMGRNRLLAAVLGIVGQVDKQNQGEQAISDISDAELATTIQALMQHGLSPADDNGLGGTGEDQDAAEETA